MLHRRFLYRNLAATQDEARKAGDLMTFEDVVIDSRLLGFSLDGLLAPRVPDDEIGIGPNQDRALFGVTVQDLGNVSGGNGHEFVHGQQTGVHPIGPE